MSSSLPPKDSRNFSVNFKPNFPGAFYDATLECYVYPLKDTWEELGPPWNYKFPEHELFALSSASSSHKELSSAETNSASANSATNRNIPATITSHKSIQENNKKTDSKSSGDASQMVDPKGAASKTAVTSNSSGSSSRKLVTEVGSKDIHNLDDNNHQKPEQVAEQYSEHGYFMKVKMTRLNEGQETEFMVTPVTPKINLYDLPDVLLSDDEINRHLQQRSSHSTDLVYAQRQDGLESDPYSPEWNENTNSNNNDDGHRELSISTIDYHGHHDHDEHHLGASLSSSDPHHSKKLDINSKTVIPSIHPSKLSLPGSDEGDDTTNAVIVLDSIKRVALPMCITLKVTGKI